MRLPSLSYIAGNARAAFHRFPYVLVCAALSCFLSILLIENESTDFWFTKLFMTCALGIPLFFSLTLYAEKPLKGFKPHPLALPLAGVLLLIGFYFLSSDAQTENFFLNYAQWALVFHLLAAFAPFLAKGETNGFWQFNRSLFLRFCLSALYAGVFYLGLALALSAIQHLLDVKVHDKLYFDLWVFSVFILQTWHFLAGLPEDLKQLEAWDDYPTALKVFAQYLLVPLITLYVLILYLYLGKIVLHWDWPKGTVTWLVSFVSLFGVFTLMLLYPAEHKKENVWIKVFAKGFYVGLIPLIGMLFLAVGKRISPYGVTEQRYFVMVLAVWILGMAAYFLSGSNRTIKTVPMTLFLVALLTSFGPWGAYDVSRVSQANRLKALLIKDGLWKDGKAIKATGEVPLEDRKQISSILDYLIENHGVAPLKGWFDVDLSKWDSGRERSRYGYASISGQICTSMGFAYLNRWETAEQGAYFNYSASSDDQGIAIAGFDRLMRVSAWKQTVKTKDCNWTLVKDKLLLEVSGHPPLTFDLKPMLDRIEALPAADRNKLTQDLLTVDASSGPLSGQLVLQDLNGTRKSTGVEINSVQGFLLLKTK